MEIIIFVVAPVLGVFVIVTLALLCIPQSKNVETFPCLKCGEVFYSYAAYKEHVENCIPEIDCPEW